RDPAKPESLDPARFLFPRDADVGQIAVAGRRLLAQQLVAALAVDADSRRGNHYPRPILDGPGGDRTDQRAGAVDPRAHQRLAALGAPLAVARALARQVHDAVDVVECTVVDVAVVGKPFVDHAAHRQIDARVVEIARQRDDFVTCFEKPLDQAATHESGRTGDEDFHWGMFTTEAGALCAGKDAGAQ